jgi:hypothetical protein
MIPVISGHGIALVAALADAIESVIMFAEIPAPVDLADIAAYSSRLTDMGRGSL